MERQQRINSNFKKWKRLLGEMTQYDRLVWVLYIPLSWQKLVENFMHVDSKILFILISFIRKIKKKNYFVNMW